MPAKTVAPLARRLDDRRGFLRSGRAAFDFVFTGVGALCWLPSVRRWADVVASVLKPGGRLFIREGHPMLWSLQDGRDDKMLVVEYAYFESEEPCSPTNTAFWPLPA